ncbi:MAG: helix-turn-helix transcriptional regulator [Anaerolineales bacterium]|nr:helix-turn-helix transcriptional regulator [Anaerolineales bacterium]
MTNAELAILSLISEKDRHGYEIESLIEERGMREWTEIGFSSIYYILKKLEKKKLIKGKMVRQEGPGRSRVVYHISGAGRKALRASTLEALSVPHRAYSPMQLGLANLPAISKYEALAALRQQSEGLAKHRELIQARWESQQPLPFFVDAMFDLALTKITTELDWLDRFIDQLEQTHDEN